jgi:hypothetical protein
MQMLLGCFAMVTIFNELLLCEFFGYRKVLLEYGAESLGKQILKFQGSVVSSISSDTSTP